MSVGFVGSVGRLGLSIPPRRARSPFVLDNLSQQPAVAFSMRRLTASYVGGPLLQRRAADNNEVGLGFGANGWLDELAARVHLHRGQTSGLGAATGYSGATGVSYTANANEMTLIEDTSNGVHRAQKSVSGTLLAGTTYRLSTIARRVGPSLRDIWLELFNGTITLGVSCRLSTNTAEIVSPGGTSSITASVTPISATEWLCEVTFVPAGNYSGVVTFPSLLAPGTGNTRIYLGDGQSGIAITAPMLATLAQLNGAVPALYDQSGNGRHITRVTAANQPLIATSGLVNVTNNRPSLVFGGAHSLVGATALAMQEIYLVTRSDGAAATHIEYSTGAGVTAMTALRVSPTVRRVGQSGANNDFADAVSVGALRQYTDGRAPNSMRRNGSDVAVGAGNSSSGASLFEIGGRNSSLYMTGAVAEFIGFASPLSPADRILLEADQIAAYAIV